MSSALLAPLQTAVPAGDALAPVLVVLLGGGLVGMSIRNMFESIMSEDEGGDGGAEASGEDATADGGGLMAEEDTGDGGDDLGGLGGLDDDGGEDLGSEDLGGEDFGGEDLGGFDDDGFGEMDDEGGDVDELEHRLNEMEAEVGSLSSTVNTVRNENEQISESVQEVEENVRKLLDIYEMVTRGVNPFADDVDAGMAGGGMGDGGFGLFGGENVGGAGETIDQDIAEADAEGFFDEDLIEDEESLEADADVGDVLGDDLVGDEFEDDFDEDFEDIADDGGGGGTSFQDLKEEYDSGDADWDEDGEADEDDLADEGDALEDDDELVDEVIDDEEADEAEMAAEAEAEMDAAAEQSPATGAESDTDGASTDVEEMATDSSAASADGASSGRADADATGKPYLASLPAGFAADLLVVEWLETLVEEAGVRETARAINYYESIDWIDEAVADDLQDHLAGFDGGGSAALTIDHHTLSLRYIAQLDGGGADAVAARRMSQGGGSDGIQR